MFDALFKRAHTESGRFQRLGLYPPSGGGSIVQLIEGNRAVLLELLGIMEMEEAKLKLAALSSQDFGMLFGFISDIFRIGGSDSDTGLGLAVLPRAKKVYGKEYPRATIIIPIRVGTYDQQDFAVFISKNDLDGGLDIAIGWVRDKDRASWPDKDHCVTLREKAEAVLTIITGLRDKRAAFAA